MCVKKLYKKVKLNIEKKLEKPGNFLRLGRPAAMIGDTLLATGFFYWIPTSLLNIPTPLAIIVSLILIFLIAELANFLINMVLGASSRARSYFLTAFFIVAANGLIGSQMNAVPMTILLCFLLVLSVSVLFRCIMGFVKEKRFKQIFGYVASVLALAYLVYFGIFFFTDHMGSSRVDFYNDIAAKEMPAAPQVTGFDSYLKDGAFEVATITYGPDETEDIVTKTLDFTVYDSYAGRDPMDKLKEKVSPYDFKKTPIKGKIWYPKGETGCPVLFFVHGNHVASTPSYLGYEYLGNYLASNGYVMVSVDENIINDLGEGNDKRAILFLENMKALLTENSKSGSPIESLMDPDKIAIGGHSRGGEMVATAYLFNDLNAYPDDGSHKFNYHFKISALVAIAPVVDQYMPIGNPVEIKDVNYLLIHGSNDQDVSTMMGEKQYNNVTFSDPSGGFHLKSSVYILGANHGQFNSLWGRYDMEGATNGFLNTYNFIDEAQQKLIAKAYIRTFLDLSLKGEKTYASLLSDNSAYLSYLPRTAYITNYSDTDFKSLCSFDNTVDILRSETGAKIDCTGTSNWTLTPYDRGSSKGEDYVLSLKWNENSKPEAKISFPAIDISEGAVSFGIADMNEDTCDLNTGLNYTIVLTDTSGKTVTAKSPVFVYRSLAVQLYKADVVGGSYEYKHQLQTVNITPEMFADKDFDFKKVVAIGIRANGSAKGHIIINNVGYK